MNWINGAIFFLIGLLGSLMPYLSTDDAVKYIDPTVRFWIMAGCGALLGGFGSVKAYLSIPKNGKPPIVPQPPIAAPEKTV